MAKVTVAVVSWNTRELLARCLRSFAADADRGMAEVWVVDNGSTDGSRELVRDQFPWARLVEAETNLGFGPAVNVVAERSTGEWIAPSNADVELEPGALARLVAAARSDPDAAIVAPRLVLPDGSTQHSIYAFPSPANALLLALRVDSLSVSVADRLCAFGRCDLSKSRTVDWAVGAFLLVRRDAFDAVGGFDPHQWMFAEDLDLGWRVRERGWTTRYEPSAVVRHHESAATGDAFGAERTARTVQATHSWLVLRRGKWIASLVAAVNMMAVTLEYVWLRAFRREPASRRRALFWMRLHRAGLRNRR
jgi:GT2 family glycosyltransferase